MNKNFKPINENKISSLPFGEAWNYVYESAKSTNVATLYEVGDKVDNIDLILRGHEDVRISPKDSVYIIPGHPLPKQRIKEYLKSIDAKMVDDVNKATIIAGHENVYVDNDGCDQHNLNILAFKMNGLYNPGGDEFTDELKKDFPNIKDASIPMIVSRKAYKTLGYMSDLTGKTADFVTPLGMDVLYNILSRRLKVVTEEELSSKANSGIKLSDPDIYNSLDQMFSSSDGKDHEIAMGLLVHADTKDAKYHLWKLCRKYGTIISKPHDKSSKAFRNRINYSGLKWTDRDEMLRKLLIEGKLTNYILEKELPNILEDSVDHVNGSILHQYFNVTKTELGVSVELKEDYRIKEEKDEESSDN